MEIVFLDEINAASLEMLSSVVDWGFWGSIPAPLCPLWVSRAVLIFSSVQPPKPDSSMQWDAELPHIWLWMGGEGDFKFQIADCKFRYVSSTSDSELHYLWQPQIRRIWGWLHRSWSFAVPKPSAGSGGALRLRLPPGIEPGPVLLPAVRPNAINAFLPDSVFPTNLGTMSILFGPGRGSLRLARGGRMVLDGGV